MKSLTIEFVAKTKIAFTAVVAGRNSVALGKWIKQEAVNKGGQVHTALSRTSSQVVGTGDVLSASVGVGASLEAGFDPWSILEIALCVLQRRNRVVCS